MKKQLSRDEVDRLLGVDPNERVATADEIRRIDEAVERIAKLRNVQSTEITTSEINTIIKELGIKNVKVYSKEDIVGDGKI